MGRSFKEKLALLLLNNQVRKQETVSSLSFLLEFRDDLLYPVFLLNTHLPYWIASWKAPSSMQFHWGLWFEHRRMYWDTVQLQQLAQSRFQISLVYCHQRFSTIIYLVHFGSLPLKKKANKGHERHFSCFCTTKTSKPVAMIWMSPPKLRLKFNCSCDHIWGGNLWEVIGSWGSCTHTWSNAVLIKGWYQLDLL